MARQPVRPGLRPGSGLDLRGSLPAEPDGGSSPDRDWTDLDRDGLGAPLGPASASMTHPATGQPFRITARRCADCLHFDSQLSICEASKGRQTTSSAWAACVRFLPNGRMGRFLAGVSRHPRTASLIVAGAVVGQALLTCLRAFR